MVKPLGLRPVKGLDSPIEVFLGNLYRRTGKTEQAQDHLAIASKMYREMDMRFWLEQAEAELRALV